MVKMTFKQLKVWNKATDFAVVITSIGDTVQGSRKNYRLLDQLESAAASVAMNIAEGKGRFSKNEFVQYLYISRGSLFETVTLLNIICRKGWISSDKLECLEKKALEINLMLNSLISSIRASQPQKNNDRGNKPPPDPKP